jgi:hypothetical protein
VLLLLLIAFPAMAQQPTEETTPPEQKSSAQRVDINELNGDSLGESVDVFTKHHPKLLCKRRNSILSDCHVWEDVSIAVVMPRGVEKCASAAPDAPPTVGCLQGIDAHFVNKLLAGISYMVEGNDASRDAITSTLKQKFGAHTTEDKDQTIWSNDLLILSVMLLKPNAKSSYVEITLDLKPSDTGEDI